MIDPRDRYELTKAMAVISLLGETLDGEEALKLYRALGEKRGFLERRLRHEGVFALENAKQSANLITNKLL